MKRKKLCRVMIGCMLSLLLTGCRIGDKEFVFDLQNISRDTVFSINDTECDLKETKLYLCNYMNLYGNVYGVDLWETGTEEQYLEDYVKGVTLNELTKIHCMDMIAQQQEITLSQHEKNQIHSIAETYYQMLSKEDKAMLGISQEKVEEIYLRYGMANKIFDVLTQGVNSEVSDDDARVIHVQQIFVSNRSTANTVAAKLKKEADFSSLAGNYNELDTVELDVARGQLPKPVEEVAFELENGEISSMIETEKGFYFICCVNKFQKNLTEANKSNILKQREKDAFETVYKDFVDKSVFKLNEKVWDTLVLEDFKGCETNSFFEAYDNVFKKNRD